MSYIYFDQAASSFPKPPSVANAVADAIVSYGANPGRGGHQLARKANDVILQARVKLAEMFGAKQASHVLFFLNATMALNQAIKGLNWNKGDHVITTSLEHNSVRRPLEFLKENKGIEVDYIAPNKEGLITADSVKSKIKNTTKAIIVSHGSNLTGAITPIKEIGDQAKHYNLIYIVDASQTAGILPINIEENNIDLLAFPGHKGLLGPQGTGVLIAKEKIGMNPILHGGTGSHSESSEQPQEWPERYESGTLNTPGIAGLLAGITEVNQRGLHTIFQHEWELTKTCIEQLLEIDGVRVFGPDLRQERLAVVPFTIEGIDVHEAAMILDEHYHIGLRAGLHCTPLGHQTLDTVESGGTLRASFGYENTIEEINVFIRAIKEIKEAF